MTISPGKCGYLPRCSSCFPPFNTQLLYKRGRWACVKVWTLLLGLPEPRNASVTAPSADAGPTGGREGALSPRHLPFPARPRSHRADVGKAQKLAPAIRKGKFREDSSEPISPRIVVLLVLIDREHGRPRDRAGGTAVCGGRASGRKGCQKKKVGAVGTKCTTL